MGTMDIVAVYLNVDFTISLKLIVALLQPLQLAFDAVREFIIYVPRGRDIVLRVRFPTSTHVIVPRCADSPLFLSGTVGATPDVLCRIQGPLSRVFVGLGIYSYCNFD